MPPLILNGEPGTVHVNTGTRLLFQFHCNLSFTCGLCYPYHMAVGSSFPIPLHRGCLCEQRPIFPGQASQPFVDFREMIRELDPSQQAAVMGRSNLRLVEAGVVGYGDVVTPTRIRDLREVVSREKLTVEKMVKAGVNRRQAETAYATVHTPAHELAEARRQELIDKLRGKGLADEVIRRAVAERLAARVGLGGKGGTEGLGVIPGRPTAPKTPKPRKPRTPKAEPVEVATATPGRGAGEAIPPRTLQEAEALSADLASQRSELNRRIGAAMDRKDQAEVDRLTAERERVKAAQKALEARSEEIRTGWKPAATMDEALAFAASRGVRVIPGTPIEVTLEHLNAVNREVAKMPSAVIETVMQAGRTMDVIGGRGITDHPAEAHMKGVTPRGWASGRTWDDVPGAGGPRTIVVANRLGEGHGSANLVIHEHAHTFDSSWARLHGKAPSDSQEWRDIWAGAEWPTDYQKTYPEEGYAESFAKYYHGPETRAMLPQPVRDYWARLFPEG